MKNTRLIFSGLILFGYLSCQNTLSPDVEDIVEKEHLVIPQKPLEFLTDIRLPEGYKRESVSGYGKWIRNLKLNKDNIVYYYNGDAKPNQSIHVAVLDFDIGERDLQQCADACMRIRAEYLFEQRKFNEIKFLLASGKRKSFSEYTSKRDRTSFKKYMNYIFAYANTASLKKQTKPVNSFNEIQIGDVLVQSGTPYGHAVTVMDVCTSEKGQKQFMLSQSYMPAQSIEILINPKSTTNSPWYPVNFEGDLVTPEWTFIKEDLRRF